ncbi:MAG: hypothetical protein K0R62_6975 [Nonomuraea muscovyensis]|nr:hypothetical protein [Nonomuraea muscovyensis]
MTGPGTTRGPLERGVPSPGGRAAVAGTVREVTRPNPFDTLALTEQAGADPLRSHPPMADAATVRGRARYADPWKTRRCSTSR